MSSKRNLRRKGIFTPKTPYCQGKIKYPDEDACIEAIGTLSKDPVFHGGKLNYYCCGGSHFHIGHTPHKKKVVISDKKETKT